MDFNITPGPPDGICVRVEFWVGDWDELAIMMQRLQQIKPEV